MTKRGIAIQTNVLSQGITMTRFLIQHSTSSVDTILLTEKESSLSASKKHLCPFQFQLDLSRYVDILIADYTYVYDYHDRLDLENSNIARSDSYLLVDECHNLPERVRDMYSLEVPQERIKQGISFCTERNSPRCGRTSINSPKASKRSRSTRNADREMS